MKKLLASRVAHRALGLALGAVMSAGLMAGAARAEPAMWVVKDKDSTIYMIGTVHLLRQETAWKTPKIEKALADSKELWLEIVDVDNEAAMQPLIMKHGVDQQKPLSSKLTDAQKAKLAAVSAKYGLNPAQLEPLKPWLVGLTFSVLPIQKAGFDPNAGVDRVLKAAAVKEGDKIAAFETTEEQIGFFAGMDEAEQIAFMESALDDADRGVAVLDQLANAWAAGDVDTIGKVMNEEMKADAPEVYDLLLTQRNIRWAEKIDQLLDGSGTHLVAVGAGHLAGPDSVQAQLKKRGIEAKRH
ncbi:MAG TPA: TraB/GumN family protein [Caulobacteraceae bacterium]|nr:TraB/GumN family protein [Caulobacteraceae bacterium]